MEQLEPGTSAYNIYRAARITGPLNIDALESSLNEIVRRHEVLRTTFTMVDGSPVQVVAPEATVKLESVGLREAPSDAISHSGEGRNPDWDGTEINHFITEFERRPFSLNEAPMLRAAVISLGDQEYVLVLATHHIVADAWSMGILTREMWMLYEAYASNKPISLPDHSVQYIDYAVWQRDWLQGDVLESQLSYWTKQLGGTLPVLNLPTDYPRPARQTFHGTRVALSLSVELTEALNDLSRHEGVTLFMTLLAAFNILLHRYTGEEDVLVGSPVANRNRPEIQGLIGFFVNTLVLRTDLSSSPSLRQLLSRVRDVCLDTYAHQDLPFEKLVSELQAERDLSRNPLFQVMFILQNAPRYVPAVPKLKIERMDVETTVSKFDLTLGLAERNGKLSGFIEYNTDLFDRGRIERMTGHFRTLLESIVGNPAQPISTLPILTEAEWHQILIEWNDTTAVYPKNSCIHELFESQVERTPDAVAIQFEGEHLTYGELNRRANQLAHYLRRLRVGPEKFVGICLERSLEMVVALLGILKAGGAYVPLDPTYPTERLAFMIDDANLSLIISQQSVVSGRLSTVGGPPSNVPDGPRSAVGGHQYSLAGGRPSAVGGHHRFVSLDSDWPLIERESSDNSKAATSSHNTTYVIYTSGSTGKPKGVQVSHRSVINCLFGIQNEIQLTPSDVLLAATTISFDIAALELYLPLITGSRSVLATREQITDGKLLAEMLKECGATVMQATPSGWRLLVETGWRGSEGFKILCGGETLSRELADQLLEGGASLWNVYGPTETTIWSTIAKVERDGVPVLIGRPIANTQVYVLDSLLQPVPIGVPGELYIGGDGVTRGYLNRPELTQEKFISNPVTNKPGDRLYRTGDLVSYRPNGQLRFFGRIDTQVKIRGCRVELGEVEAALNQHPAVEETVVVARERDWFRHKDLIAYLVSKPRSSPPATELRSFLRQKLPEYMIPSDFVFMDSLPRLSNEKIDRQKLAVPAGTRRHVSQNLITPRTEIERLVTRVWREVLRVEDIGIHDNFFELNGHSLLAVQIIARLRDIFDCEIPLRVLFETPTVAGLVEMLDNRISEDRGRSRELPLIVPFSRDKPLPLSLNQEHLWHMDQIIPGSHLFNMPYVYKLKGDIKIDALERALQEIVRRHEALRTVFAELNGCPVQVINGRLPLQLSVTNLSGQRLDDVSRPATALIREERHRAFDLRVGPLMRTRLLWFAESEYLLLVTMHHIISDDWSMQIFRRELTTLYRAFSRGQTFSLPNLPIQFADFASMERESMDGGFLNAQLAYWKAQLSAPLPRLEFRRGSKKKEEITFASSRHHIHLDESLVSGIQSLARNQKYTTFMVVVAALSFVLHLYSGQRDIRIGTLVANRRRKETESTIGHFVNTVVLRVNVCPPIVFEALLEQVRNVTLLAYSHQELPFEHIARMMETEAATPRDSLFQVLVVYQNQYAQPVEASGLTFASFDTQQLEDGSEITATTFDLIFNVRETPTKVFGSLIYNTDSFEDRFIRELIETLCKVLQRMTLEGTATKVASGCN